MINRAQSQVRAQLISEIPAQLHTSYHWYPAFCLTSRRLGRFGERAAAKFLLGLGHKILAYNWRCKLGEIDLVTLHHKELVIVEVKTRCSLVADWYPALAAIDHVKQQKLIKLSQFIWDRRVTLFPQVKCRNLRIDAVAITTEPFLLLGQRSRIKYLSNILSL